MVNNGQLVGYKLSSYKMDSLSNTANMLDSSTTSYVNGDMKYVIYKGQIVSKSRPVQMWPCGT